MSGFIDLYKANYSQRMAQFQAETDVAGKTIMIGDSITERWGEDGTFPEGWVNRGIAGDNTHGVIGRLQQHLDQHPKEIVLLIGANDTADNYEQNILTIIRMVKASGVKLTIVSVLPALRGAAGDRTVAEENAILATVCAANGVNFLDINGYFKLPGGQTNPDLFADIVHPNHNGLSLMASLFQKLYIQPSDQEVAAATP